MNLLLLLLQSTVLSVAVRNDYGRYRPSAYEDQLAALEEYQRYYDNYDEDYDNYEIFENEYDGDYQSNLENDYYENNLDQDYDENDYQRYYDDAQGITAEEFQSSKAVPLNKPSQAFQDLMDSKNHDQNFDGKHLVNSMRGMVEGGDGSRYGVPKNSAYGAVGAIILILTGLFMLFWGQKGIKPILFIIGFYTFSMLAYALINYLRVHKAINIDKSSGIVYFCSMLGGGLIGGGLFLCLWRIAIYLFGALLGFMATMLFLSLPFTASFSQGVRIAILVVFIIIGMITAHFIQKPVLIVATATFGSYAVFNGADHFIKTGFGSIVLALRNNHVVKLSVGIWIMAIGFLLVAIIGSVVQFRQDAAKKREQVVYQPVKKV